MTADALQERLCAEVEMLQKAALRFSRAVTAKDFALLFARIATELFPGADVHVFHQPDGAAWWQSVVAGRKEDVERFLPAAGASLPQECVVRELEDGRMVTQGFADGTAIAVVCFRGPEGDPGTVPEHASLKLVALFCDRMYQEFHTRRKGKDLAFSLNQRILQLNSLVDSGIEIAKLDQHASVVHLALERAVALTNASTGRVRVQMGGVQIQEVVFPDGVVIADDQTGRGQIETEVEFKGVRYTFELHGKESRDGVLRFDATDRLLLDALARHVQALLESRDLHQQALEKEKMERDIAVAASIQERILPAALPDIPGYDIAGINIPSKSVGGDYYDCIPLADGRLALVMADVAGKGIPAALLVSSLHAYLRAYLESGVPLVPLVRRLNQVIYSASTDDKFITAFIAILSPQEGTLESVNAGHNPVFLLRSDGSVHELNAGGLALGMLALDFPYESETSAIGKNEGVLLYTDGIPEAADGAMQLYESRTPLKAFLQSHRDLPPRMFIDALMKDIREFTGDAPQNDDITALYLFRRP